MCENPSGELQDDDDVPGLELVHVAFNFLLCNFS